MNSKNSEIKTLDKLYNKSHSPIAVLYGRKGVGKNEIVKQFATGKKCISYISRNASCKLQLEFFAQELGIDISEKDDCDFESIIEGVLDNSDDKTLIIINEFELIFKKDDTFFNQLIDLNDRFNLMIVLTCSEIPWINKEFIECINNNKYKDKVYLEKIEEWSFLDTVRAFEDYSIEELVKLYGVFGGVNRYLSYIDQSSSVEDNIKKLVLNKKGSLYDEAEKFLSSELREISVYNTILYAIASGNTKLNELYKSTGFSRAKISVYLKNLAAFDVVEKIESFDTGGWQNAKKGVYAIKNNFIDFWFRFIYPNLNDLDRLTGDEFYAKHIENKLDIYLDRYFIKICREYLMLMNYSNELPLEIKNIGTWQGKSGSIDIVAQNDIREQLVAKCFWKEDIVTDEDFKKLLEAANKAKIKPKYYYIFASGSFNEKLKALESQLSSVVLIDIGSL